MTKSLSGYDSILDELSSHSSSLAEKATETDLLSLTTTVYNANVGLKQWRAALAKLKAGYTNIYNLQFVGDSITEGGKAGTYQTGGFVGRVRSALATKFGDVGMGMIPTYYPNNSPLWTFTGTGWVDGTDGFGCTQRYKKSNTNGDTATISVSGTSLGIIVARGSGSGSFSVSVDGGATQSFNTNNTTVMGNAQYIVSGLTDASHSVTITNNDTTGKSLYLLGIYGTRGNAGIRCNMVGRWGTIASDSMGNDYALQSEIDFWSPILTVIALTANDTAAQTSLTTYQNNLQTIISRAKQYGDVLLVSTGIETNTGLTIPQSSYVNTMKSLALSNNVAFVDIFNRWGGDANYVNNTLGFLVDNVHPNDYGHQDIATAILNVLLEPAS